MEYIISNPHNRMVTLSGLGTSIPAKVFFYDLSKLFTVDRLEKSVDLKVAFKNHWLYPADKCPYPNGLTNFNDMRRTIGTDEEIKVRIDRKLGGLGDVLFTSVVCRAIKEKYPHSHITYAVTYDYYGNTLSTLCKHNPYIDSVINCNVKDENVYDYVFDLTSSEMVYECNHQPKIKKSRIELHLETVGLWCEDRRPVYVVTEEEHNNAVEWLKKRNIGNKIIGIELRCNAENRNWPLKHIKELCNIIRKETDYEIILFDHHTDWAWKQEGVYGCLCEKIEVVAAIMELCDVFIAPDSGLLHMAGALDLNVIAVMGQIDGEQRTKEYKNASYIQRKDLKCCPCWYRPVKGCKRECLEGISAADVFECIKNKLIF